MNGPFGNAPFQPALDFDAAGTAAAEGEALVIDIDGFEGPLDLLLTLARAQKVDLLKLSITRLADQYLAFVRQAVRARFALAADYLVMAAWLAFLKSRLLLPRAEQPASEVPPAETAAAQLAFRLAKLDAMRRAAEVLGGRPRLKRDVFMRGDPEAVSVISHRRLDGDLHALMAAYLRARADSGERTYRPPPVEAYRLDDARDRLRSLLPQLEAWTALSQVAPDPAALVGAQGALAGNEPGEGPSRASCVASTLSAGLELVREGHLEARQLAAFEEIYLRATPVPQ
jgi:segregation and condensation protein A